MGSWPDTCSAFWFWKWLGPSLKACLLSMAFLPQLHTLMSDVVRKATVLPQHQGRWLLRCGGKDAECLIVEKRRLTHHSLSCSEIYMVVVKWFHCGIATPPRFMWQFLGSVRHVAHVMSAKPEYLPPRYWRREPDEREARNGNCRPSAVWYWFWGHHISKKNEKQFLSSRRQLVGSTLHECTPQFPATACDLNWKAS